jgi:hypothetical protein
VRWDVNAGPAVAWQHFEGTDFDRPSTENGLAVGGYLNLRLATSQAHQGWFGLGSAQVFPGDYRVNARGAPGERWTFLVPRFAFGLAVGAWVSP